MGKHSARDNVDKRLNDLFIKTFDRPLRPEPSKVTHDQWTDALGVEYWVHRWNTSCTDGCAIHAPSDHPMKTWPQIMRADKRFLVERVCKHGCGHPDPDSIAFFEDNDVFDYHNHDCDGCCSIKNVSGRGIASTQVIPCNCERWDCYVCNPNF